MSHSPPIESSRIRELGLYYEHLGLPVEYARDRARRDLAQAGPPPDREVSPTVTEVGLLLSPFLLVPATLALCLPIPALMAMTLAVSTLWAVGRFLRERTLSRVVIVGFLSPLTFVATSYVALAVERAQLLLGSVPALQSALSSLGLLAFGVGYTLILGAVSRFLARKNVSDARFLLYYQALFAVVGMPLVFHVAAGFGLWIVLTFFLWFSGAFLYLIGDGFAQDAVGRMMRAWISLGLTVHLILAVGGLGFQTASFLLPAVLYGPLFLLDRGLGPSYPRTQALLPSS